MSTSTKPTKPQPPPPASPGFKPWQYALGFTICAMPFGLMSYARRGGPISVIKEIRKNREARLSSIPKKEGPLTIKEYEQTKGWKEDKNDLF
jgi:hypothetical protein